MSVQAQLKQFLVQNFYIADPAELTDDTSLVTTGLVDSTGMLEVIAHLESEFGIQITDQETTPENLDSIARMAAFVARKQAAK
jgi:acyl carrier protein